MRVLLLLLTLAPLLCEGAMVRASANETRTMFDPEFFPTPPAVVSQMLAPYFKRERGDMSDHLQDEVNRAQLRDMMILEPSAGSGAMLDAVTRKLGENYARYHAKEKIHCIERNPELAAILKGKSYTVVHDDFLTFETSLRYDLILMNPPFSNGDEHLLKAWELMYEGDIVCLLNAQTVRLPHTERRKRMVELIREHGSVEYIGQAFRQAERRTDVEVAIVRLHKKDESHTFDFFDDANVERDGKERDFSFDEDNMNTPAVNDQVKLFVDQFKEAQETFVEYMKARHRMKRKASTFMNASGSALEELLRDATNAGEPSKQYNFFSARLQATAWNMIFANTKVYDLMSKSVRENFERMQKEHGAVTFNEANIHGLFDMLFLNRGEILKQSLVDAFEQMTRYHAHNRVDEGWATNDAYKVNRKVIMPYAVEQGYHGNMRLKSSYAQTVNDVDRALAMLNAKKLSQVFTARQALERHLADYKVNHGALEDNTVESEHFKLRFFKKGTVHLYFLSEDLWRRFNIAAAQGKNWLPHDYGREPNTTADAPKPGQLLLTT
jgi:hypothetical protein